jgi:hypothetical protein
MLGPSFLAAFELPDGRFALVAAQRGAIVPGADFIGSEEEVNHRLQEMWAMTDDNFRFDDKHVYAPAAWGFGEQELDVAELLIPKNLSKRFRLQQLTFGLSKGEILKLSILAILILGAGAAWLVYEDWSAKIEADERAREKELAKQRLAELNRKALEAQKSTALDHPWSKMPNIKDMSAVCVSAIHAVPISVDGWLLDSASCDAESQNASYVRTGNATVLGFKAGIRQYLAGPITFGSAGEAANVQGDITLGYGGDQELLDAETALQRVTSHFQERMIDAEIEPVEPVEQEQAALPGSKQEQKQPKAEWAEFGFTYSDLRDPRVTADGLGRVPSARLISVTAVLDERQITWKVKGAFYAKD